MHAELPEKLKKARNIAKFRDMTRSLHTYSFLRTQAIAKRHELPLYLLGFSLGLIATCLPVDLSVKVLLFVGGTVILILSRFAFMMYISRSDSQTEKEFSIQYERQLFKYLETYYAVDTKYMEYSMRPVNAYVINAGKVKKIWAHEFDNSILPVGNDLIITPDLNGVLYFGRLTIDGERVDNITVQLTPERNIVLLNKGVEIEPLPVLSKQVNT